MFDYTETQATYKSIILEYFNIKRAAKLCLSCSGQTFKNSETFNIKGVKLKL